MIIALSGYGNSGASAVLDFLRGITGLQVVPFEFQLLHQADGILDLKYHLTQSRERVACNAAIKRFRKLMYKSISGHRIEKIVGNEYKTIVENYLNKIVMSEWRGRSNYDPVDLTDRSTNRVICFIQQGVTHMLRKINKAWCVPGLKTRYFSIIDEEVFDKATIDFLTELFRAAGYDLSSDLVLDMVLSATNPLQGMEFFQDIKTIIVARDPRDSYIRLKENVFQHSFMPQGSVEDFCDFYEAIRTTDTNDNRILVIQYEDLIYKYNDTKKLILEYLGYNIEPQNEFRFFNPNVSVRYTNLMSRYPKYEKELAYIESRLSRYCYRFTDYNPLPVDVKYDGNILF